MGDVAGRLGERSRRFFRSRLWLPNAVKGAETMRKEHNKEATEMRSIEENIMSREISRVRKRSKSRGELEGGGSDEDAMLNCLESH